MPAGTCIMVHSKTANVTAGKPHCVSAGVLTMTILSQARAMASEQFNRGSGQVCADTER